MTHTNETDQLIQDNPQVDAEQVREAESLIADLRRQGMARPEFNLSLPYENGLRRRRARCESADGCLPRHRRHPAA